MLEPERAWPNLYSIKPKYLAVFAGCAVTVEVFSLPKREFTERLSNVVEKEER